MNWLGVLVALAIAMLAVGALFGVVAGRIALRWTVRQLRRKAAGLLPTDAAVVGAVPAVTPPVTLRSLRGPLLLAIFPGFFLGPLVVPLWAWLFTRGRSFRAIAFTDDDQTWLLARTRWSGKLIGIVGQQPTALWTSQRRGTLRVTTVGEETVSFAGWGLEDQLPPAR